MYNTVWITVAGVLGTLVGVCLGNCYRVAILSNSESGY